MYAVWALEKQYADEQDTAKTVEIHIWVGFFVSLR